MVPRQAQSSPSWEWDSGTGASPDPAAEPGAADGWRGEPGVSRSGSEASCHGDGLIKHRSRGSDAAPAAPAGGEKGQLPCGDGEPEGDTRRVGQEFGL